MVKAGHQRPRRSEPDRKKKTAANVDPEEIAGQGMIDFFSLDDGLGKSVQSKTDEKQAEGSHHGHQTKVLGRQ